MKVPFVDGNYPNKIYKYIHITNSYIVVTTAMLDPSLPLTIHEYEEWGNPSESTSILKYMLSYDPYRNLNKIKRANILPSGILLTASTLDERVPYWHPTKWVAKLRETLPENESLRKNIFLTVDHQTGHFGDGGQHNYYKQLAKETAFLIDTVSKEKDNNHSQ
jgi:oligopeptidase B